MSNHSVLNPQAIETLRSLNPDDSTAFLNELIEIYLHDVPERIAEIDAALLNQDASGAMRAAHSIKGSSGNFGATALAELSHKIELQGKAGTLTETAATLAALKAEYAQVVLALNALSQAT